jgi:hypothetical protein
MAMAFSSSRTDSILERRKNSRCMSAKFSFSNLVKLPDRTLFLNLRYAQVSAEIHHNAAVGTY